MVEPTGQEETDHDVYVYHGQEEAGHAAVSRGHYFGYVQEPDPEQYRQELALASSDEALLTRSVHRLAGVLWGLYQA